MQSISLDQSGALIPDGASLMIGGFMAVGTPERVINEIVRQEKRDLTVIANDTAAPGRGIGTGAPPEEGMAHPTFTDAGGRPVTALPGTSTFDSATSFGLIRGGHIDLTVLGGLQVAQEGHPRNGGQGKA